MSDTARQAARLLFLHAQTGLHPGSGTALGTVDLPVQRERHTHWPCVPGSALKGILRDRARENTKGRHGGDRKKANEDDADLVAAFGPGKGDQASDHAGALAVTDARLAAFPVRSLRGVFAWVTCPAVLTRLNRDLLLGRTDVPPLPMPAGFETAFADDKNPQGGVTPSGDEKLLCAVGSPLKVGDKVVLEEFEYTATGTCDELATWFATRATADDLTRARLRSHLAVISDNAFTHYARHATEVIARIALNYDTKTVAGTALFYQEVLPAETLLYAVVLANPSRVDVQKRTAGALDTAGQVLDYLAKQLGPNAVLQVGGDETVGKGLCFAHLTDGRGN